MGKQKIKFRFIIQKSKDIHSDSKPSELLLLSTVWNRTSWVIDLEHST